MLGCIRDAVDDLLYGFLRGYEKGAVVSKQQLCGEFRNGFHACEETLKIEQTARKRRWMPSSWSSFASRSMILKKTKNKLGAETHTSLTPLETGKLPGRSLLNRPSCPPDDPIVQGTELN